RGPDAAVGQGALVDLDAHVALRDRHEIAPQAPGAAAVAPAHLEHVAKAAGRDDPDLRAAALEQRVGPCGGAVHDGIDGADAAERFEAAQEALRLVAALGRHFCSAAAAGRRIEQEQVGEGPADVAPDAPTAPAHLGARAFAVASAASEPSSRSTAL